MRFQMESAKIPYMKRTFDDGILEVWQIYGTQYKAKWTPIGGVDVCYVVRYLNSEADIRYILMDDKMSKLGEFLESPITELENLISYEYKINEQLILTVSCPSDMKSATIRFYSTLTGRFLAVDNSYFTLTQTNSGGDPLVLRVGGAYPTYPAVYVLVKGDTVYTSCGQWLRKTVIENTGGVYVFTPTTFNFPAIGTNSNPSYPVQRFLQLEDEIFYYIWDTTYTPRTSCCVTVDKDTGGITEDVSPNQFFPANTHTPLCDATYTPTSTDNILFLADTSNYVEWDSPGYDWCVYQPAYSCWRYWDTTLFTDLNDQGIRTAILPFGNIVLANAPMTYSLVCEDNPAYTRYFSRRGLPSGSGINGSGTVLIKFIGMFSNTSLWEHRKDYNHTYFSPSRYTQPVDIYDNTGQLIFSYDDIADSESLYINAGVGVSANVKDIGWEWRNTDKYLLGYRVLRSPISTADYYIEFGGDPENREKNPPQQLSLVELWTKFHVPTDADSLLSINYLPHLERNPYIQKLLGV